MNKITGLIFLFLASVVSIVSAQDISSGRVCLNMNTNWAFSLENLPNANLVDYDDTKWDGVSIPHVMRVEPKHNGGKVYQGVGWYRRYFNLSNTYKNKRIVLQFEGVQMSCKVYLNEKLVAEHAGGYMGFAVDITDEVQFGKDNLLAVRVINEDDPQTPPGKPLKQLDFNFYGGIYRNVSLLITDKVYISDPLQANEIAGGGVLVTYADVSKKSATVNAKTHVVNDKNIAVDIQLRTLLLDHHGQEVVRQVSEYKTAMRSSHTFNQNLDVIDPKLWHPDHPNRYQLVSQVYENNRLVDEIKTMIGIRRFDFSSPIDHKKDGLYINGEKFYVRGANRHQAFAYVGDAASNSMQYRDALLLKEGGFNAVRVAHYPGSPAFLDACDELGLLVIECQPGWQYFSKDSTFVARTYRDIQQMIRRDRNHPSIFLWETSLNESPTPASWMEKAVKTAHAELPGDQLFTADDYNSRSKPFYDVFYKVVNQDGTDPMPDKPSFTREWGDAWYANPQQENGLRASRIYGEKGLLNQAILRQNALNGETSEAKGGYWDHAGLDANPRIGGYFLWSFNDYARGYDTVTAFSGVVDIDRYPKYGFYQTQSMQDAQNKSYGPMLFIASHNRRKDMDKSVHIFSNCDTVRLYRNGSMLGEKSRVKNAETAPYIFAKGGSPMFVFDLGSYEEGELKAEGLINGQVVATHIVHTPGKPHHLQIEIADKGVLPQADGSDMFPVYVKVCDENGNLVNYVGKKPKESLIKLAVSGEGKLIGGNFDWPNVNPQYTEGGIAYFLIRTSQKAGDIIIKAQSEGMATAEAGVKTVGANRMNVPDGKHAVWIPEYDKKLTLVNQQNPAQTALHLVQVAELSIFEENKKVGTAPDLHDGNLTTSWDANTLPFVLIADFGKKITLEAYRIYWGKDSDWYTYSLSLSLDGKNWSTVEKNKTVSGQDYGINTLQKKLIRYVKIQITGLKPENSNVKIREIQFFGN